MSDEFSPHVAFRTWEAKNESVSDIEARIHDGVPHEQLHRRADDYLDSFENQFPEARPRTGANLMEIGVGVGYVMQAAVRRYAPNKMVGLDIASGMIDKARQRLAQLPDETQRRVTFVQADGLSADQAVGGRRFAAVLCHGVLGYLDDPEPLVDQLCRCTTPGGIVSIMTGNANTMAIQPALERRWDDALASFDVRTGVGVLGVRGRADTVEEVSELIQAHGVQPERWYGVWLFVDWLEFSGAELDPTDSKQVAAIAAVELEAARRDPYRQAGRVFHLVGRKAPSSRTK